MNNTDLEKPTTERVLATEILKVPEVARYLRISRAQAYALVRRGVIPSFHIAGSPRVRRTDLLTWIERQAQSQ